MQDEAVGAACPVCDAPGPHPVLLRTGPHTLIRCTGCTGCFYQDRNRPDYAADQPSALFNQVYVEQNAGIHYMSRLLWTFDDDPACRSVLDVGCGFGFSVDVAQKVLGWRAVGIDPSQYASDGHRMLGADIRRAYLTDETDLGEPFGLLLAVEVIEHIPDLYPFMALLRRWMQPGGKLVFTTPNADALAPDVDPGMLFAMLSAGGHLVLFNPHSMELMLRRAGFQHVRCELVNLNLVVYASDAPMAFRTDVSGPHMAGYEAYLRRVLETAPPGEPLWNGAAGRLMVLEAKNGPVERALALFAQVTEVWRARFGIDLARRRLPPPIQEAEFGRPGPDLVERLCQTQPLNMAGLLYQRAMLETRLPGRLPETVLGFAGAAYAIAQQTCRTLEEYGLIDADLKGTTWRARMLCTDMLVELSPGLEGSLLIALASPAPGGLAGRIDPPAALIIPRLATFFVREVHAQRYDDAARFEPVLAELDLVVTAIGERSLELYHTLFCLGALRLNALHDPAGAHAAFMRLEQEAAADPSDLGLHFAQVARDHVTIASAQLPPAPTRLDQPSPAPPLPDAVRRPGRVKSGGKPAPPAEKRPRRQ